MLSNFFLHLLLYSCYQQIFNTNKVAYKEKRRDEMASLTKEEIRQLTKELKSKRNTNEAYELEDLRDKYFKKW